MPATMGMMTLGRLIMTLVEDRDSWDYSSLMIGMMGGRGMGGMGMGMGGMGMGGRGGFRSVPPTGLAHATLNPNQSRHLPTVLVSLNGPTPDGNVPMPGQGEKLRVGTIGQITGDRWASAALMRLAGEKAPPEVAQLVLWNLADGFDWPAQEAPLREEKASLRSVFSAARSASPSLAIERWLSSFQRSSS